jgi:hypothetical protein
VQPTVQPPCNHFDFHDGGRCLLRCMSLLLALFGHGEMSELSPLSGVKLKSDFGAVRAAFDPTLGRDDPACSCYTAPVRPQLFPMASSKTCRANGLRK